MTYPCLGEAKSARVKAYVCNEHVKQRSHDERRPRPFRT